MASPEVGQSRPLTFGMKDMKTLLATIGVISMVLSVSAQELKPLPDMTTAKVATARAAKETAIKYVIVKPGDGLSETEAVSAEVAFSIGFDVEDFGKKGDRVWQVHFVEFGETLRIAWVNAETGKVRFIHPEKK